MQALGKVYFLPLNDDMCLKFVAENLITDIDLYTKHVTDHLWKENNRLFMMADMRLAESSDEIDAELAKSEADLLSMTGNPRSHYERISKDLTEYATEGEKSF